jgi:large subunit ribosomal protein L16
LLIRPRKFKYKNISKRRFFRLPSYPKLNFGQIGLLLLQPLRLNSRQMGRFKIFLKRSSKRGDKTLRKVWFNLFPHVPISRKVAGSRMGKGKGKLAGWSSEVPAGLYITEVKNLRYGRSIYFLKQMGWRLATKTRINANRNKYTPLTLKSNIYIRYTVIW